MNELKLEAIMKLEMLSSAMLQGRTFLFQTGRVSNSVDLVLCEILKHETNVISKLLCQMFSGDKLSTDNDIGWFGFFFCCQLINLGLKQSENIPVAAVKKGYMLGLKQARILIENSSIIRVPILWGDLVTIRSVVLSILLKRIKRYSPIFASNELLSSITSALITAFMSSLEEVDGNIIPSIIYSSFKGVCPSSVKVDPMTLLMDIPPPKGLSTSIAVSKGVGFVVAIFEESLEFPRLICEESREESCLEFRHDYSKSGTT